ncbi:MAG TPA: hypothetical protein VFK40_01575 [Nitrososphaeraceae archaeon]|nr:hypothetical protein [Nitrososphaeraceae archaeon]
MKIPVETAVRSNGSAGPQGEQVHSKDTSPNKYFKISTKNITDERLTVILVTQTNE